MHILKKISNDESSGCSKLDFTCVIGRFAFDNLVSFFDQCWARSNLSSWRNKGFRLMIYWEFDFCKADDSSRRNFSE